MSKVVVSLSKAKESVAKSELARKDAWKRKRAASNKKEVQKEKAAKKTTKKTTAKPAAEKSTSLLEHFHGKMVDHHAKKAEAHKAKAVEYKKAGDTKKAKVHAEMAKLHHAHVKYHKTSGAPKAKKQTVKVLEKGKVKTKPANAPVKGSKTNRIEIKPPKKQSKRLQESNKRGTWGADLLKRSGKMVVDKKKKAKSRKSQSAVISLSARS
jgi:hypothetical protein